MARPPRIEFDGAWYHVMNRGAGRRKIFLDDGDRKRFLHLLGEIHDVWNVEVHAYSLLDNHYHLLIHTPNGKLSQAMRHLGGEFTQSFNKKHKTDGSLFRGRFKSILAEKDAYFLALVRYIHLNPVRAGICRVPEDHKWTSHVVYLKKKHRPKWLIIDEVLREFGGCESVAVRRLHDYVISKTAPDLAKVLNAKRRLGILGSDGFRDWVKMNLLDSVRKDRVIPALRLVKRERLASKMIVRCVANDFQISPSALIGKMGRQANQPKSIVMELLRSVNGMTHAEIAKFLDLTAHAVSKNLQRLKRARSQSEELNERIIATRNNLLSHVQS